MPKLTKKLIKDYLSTHFLMQLATYGKHPWIANVYYTFDNDLNIYFLSNPITLHCKQIAQNSKVAVAITDSNQGVTSSKKGIQLWGEAEQISNIEKIKHAIKLWKTFLNVTSPKISYESMAKQVYKGRMYKISPRMIKFYNDELFDTDDGQEPVLEFK